MTKESINDYTRKITQSSRTGLIVIMYELANDYLCEAKKAYASDNHEAYRQECMNAQKVVRELMSALDYSYELAQPLSRIYEYFLKEISMAVIKNKTDGIDNVVRFLSSLKGSFEKIAKEDVDGPIMGNTQSVYAGLTYGKGVLNENISVDSNRGYTV